jgi:hypothetical protein
VEIGTRSGSTKVAGDRVPHEKQRFKPRLLQLALQKAGYDYAHIQPWQPKTHLLTEGDDAESAAYQAQQRICDQMLSMSGVADSLSLPLQKS